MSDSDVGAFLARLVRLDPAALVRVKVAGGVGALWSKVPWDVLVTRAVPDFGPDRDITVRADAWLAAGATATLDDLPREDGGWRGALPAGAPVRLEEIPADVLRRLDAAAAQTVRDTAEGGLAGRAVGSRAVRDALLDHVSITVTTADGVRVDVPQRLVAAVLRMGFAGADPVRVIAAGPVRPGGFLGLAATYGTAWWRRPGGLVVRPAR
jgi:hypothetical protein